MDPQPMRLIVAVVDRTKSKRLIRLLNRRKIRVQLAAPGVGTAPSELQSYLGFGETEKTVVLAFVAATEVPSLFDAFGTELDFDKPNTGVAFSLPVSTVSGLTALRYLLGEPKSSR